MTKTPGHKDLKNYVINHLLRAILSGEYDRTGKLPAERKLCEELKVSRNTMRRALCDMRMRGIIRSTQGSGWEVMDISKRLSSQSVAVISVLGDELSQQVLKGIREALPDSYTPSLIPIVFDEYGSIMDYVDVSHCAGAIILSGASIPESTLEELQSANLPIVTVFYAEEHPDFETVCPDHVQSVQLVLDYLYERGHRNITYLTHDIAEDPSFRIRTDAYCRIMEEKGLTPNVIDFREINWFSQKVGDRVVESIRQEEDLPDAVVCSHVMWAEELLFNLQRFDISVPGDVSLIAFNDSNHFAGIFEGTGLTGITRAIYPTYEMGKKAAEILQNKLNYRRVPALTLLPAEIKEENSVAEK